MLARIVSAVVVVALGATVGYYVFFQEVPHCELCFRHLHPATFFRMQLPDDEQIDACCARCGLNSLDEGTKITGAEVGDFNSGERMDASKAFFVEGSSVSPCSEHSPEIHEDRSGIQYGRTWDRCEPSLIAFKTKQAALDFSQQYGGHMTSFAELFSGRIAQ